MLFTAPIMADQTDPRLQPLFEKLPSIELDNQNRKQVEGQIWAIWMSHDNPMAEYLLRKATSEMAMGDMDSAESSFTELIYIAPNFSEAWNKRATLHYINDNYIKSIEDIKETLKL